MRIMIITDSPLAGSGFGEEMRHISFRLAQAGHEIFFVGFSYGGRPVNLSDDMFSDIPTKGAKIKLLGQFGDIRATFGAEALNRYYDIYKPDLVMLMGDPKHVAPYANLKRTIKFPLLFYVTLDGLPVLPQWSDILNTIPDINVAMTEWAMNEYTKAGMQFHGYIHHGVNWDWWQTNEGEKEKLRIKYGIPKDYTIFINWDMNQHRKRMDALLRCWRAFNPVAKKAKLLLFTDFYCQLGWNLDEKILQYGIDESTIIRPRDLIGREKVWGCSEEEWLLREIAVLGDIYLSTTSGEGFGKCLLEAMTIGMPVVAPNYSAVPEVLDKYGVLVPITGTFQEPDRLRSCESGLVDEKIFTQKMEYYYTNVDERIELGIKAKEWARNFDYDTQIMVGWNQHLSRINPDVLLARQMLQL